MNDKKKKLFIIAGCSIAALALIVAIAIQFHKTPSAEDILPTSGTTSSEVTLKSDVSVPDKTGEKDVIIQPNSTDSSKSVDSTPPQTDQPVQNIQPDVTKPKAPEPPKVSDNTDTTNPKQPPEYKPEDTEKKPVESKPQGGLPGFDNVPDGGANQVTNADDMYENGNKIGEMN